MHRSLRWLAWLGAVFMVFQVVLRVVRKLHPFPMPFEGAVILENPLRLRFNSPRLLVERLDLRPGMRVLEIGTGPGVFTVPVARAVGNTGLVVGLDIQPGMLARAAGKVHDSGLTNAPLVQADATLLPFADHSFDVAYFMTVLGEIPDKQAALEEVNRVLRPGGLLSVSELLPDPDYALASTTATRCREAGFHVDRQFGNFFAYTLNCRRP